MAGEGASGRERRSTNWSCETCANLPRATSKKISSRNSAVVRACHMHKHASSASKSRAGSSRASSRRPSAQPLKQSRGRMRETTGKDKRTRGHEGGTDPVLARLALSSQEQGECKRWRRASTCSRRPLRFSHLLIPATAMHKRKLRRASTRRPSAPNHQNTHAALPHSTRYTTRAPQTASAQAA